MRTLEEELLHPGDVELVQLMDGELPDETSASVRAHIDGCCSCRERIEELEGISGWFHSTVEETDSAIEVDEMARARALSAVRIAARNKTERQPLVPQGWFRAAAAILLIIGGGLSVSPLRAWLLDPGGEEAVQAPVVAAPVQAAAPADAGARLSFRPVTASFTIELANPQTVGTVTIGRSPTGQASAQIIGGTEQESVMILPSGLRIENAPESTASYRILLPATLVRQFEITSGSEVLLSEGMGSGRAETVLNLGAAAQ